MKLSIALFTTLLTTVGFSVSVRAQIRNPSQEFFETGREGIEKEIRTLQGEPPKSEQSLQKPQSEPLLRVSPSPANDSTQKPNEDTTPRQKPNEVNNNQPK